MTPEASFNRQALSLSRPTALFVFRDLRAFCTKFTVTLLRLNSQGGVLVIGIVGIFRNGLASTV